MQYQAISSHSIQDKTVPSIVDDVQPTTIPTELFTRRKIDNEFEVIDFDVDAIIEKFESLLNLLEN